MSFRDGWLVQNYSNGRDTRYSHTVSAAGLTDYRLTGLNPCRNISVWMDYFFNLLSVSKSGRVNEQCGKTCAFCKGSYFMQELMLFPLFSIAINRLFHLWKWSRLTLQTYPLKRSKCYPVLVYVLNFVIVLCSFIACCLYCPQECWWDLSILIIFPLCTE